MDTNSTYFHDSPPEFRTNIHFAHLQVSVAHPQALKPGLKFPPFEEPKGCWSLSDLQSFFLQRGAKPKHGRIQGPGRLAVVPSRRRKSLLSDLYQNTNSYEKLRAFQEFTSLYKYVYKRPFCFKFIQVAGNKPVISFVC